MVVARCCKEAIQKAKKNQFVQPAEDPKVGFISLASTMVGINNCLKSSVVSNLFGDELGLHDFNPESHDSSAINRGPDWVIAAPKSFENIPAQAPVMNNTNYQRADAVEPLWRQTCMKLLRIDFAENRNMPWWRLVSSNFVRRKKTRGFNHYAK